MTGSRVRRHVSLRVEIIEMPCLRLDGPGTAPRHDHPTTTSRTPPAGTVLRVRCAQPAHIVQQEACQTMFHVDNLVCFSC